MSSSRMSTEEREHVVRDQRVHVFRLEVLEARPAAVVVGAAAAFADAVLARGEYAPLDGPFELRGFALREGVQVV